MGPNAIGALVLVGLLSLIAGAWWIYPPAGLIALGLICVAIAAVNREAKQ